jgi:hypothetical protein
VWGEAQPRYFHSFDGAPQARVVSSEREVTFHCQIKQGAKKIASNEATSSARAFEVSCEGQVE